jgi:hypothetical protein
LADVITKIVNRHPNSQIDDLLPWAYPTAPALKAVAYRATLLFLGAPGHPYWRSP